MGASSAAPYEQSFQEISAARLHMLQRSFQFFLRLF